MDFLNHTESPIEINYRLSLVSELSDAFFDDFRGVISPTGGGTSFSYSLDQDFIRYIIEQYFLEGLDILFIVECLIHFSRESVDKVFISHISDHPVKHYPETQLVGDELSAFNVLFEFEAFLASLG